VVETILRIEPGPSAPPRRPTALDPCTLVIHGGTGDLARRKLVPALYNLAKDGMLPEKFAVVGLSRSATSADAFREQHREATAKFSRTPVDPEAWRKFAEHLDCVAGDLRAPATYHRLAEKLAAIDQERGTGGNRIHYFATPASEFPELLDHLAASGLLGRKPSPWTRVVIEKPFGRDLASARDLNALLARYLDESQVFRIDHYLGKETVQNIFVFRFGNSIFEPIWNRRCIDHVQITASETIGIEGRGRFYDETGIVRDMVQNHLLQLLATCGIEAPVSFAADDVRDEKVRFFRSIRRMTEKEVGRSVVLGQYRGYTQEPGVARDSRTPTYAALRFFVDNWRWQGVPFYVRTGKRLATRLTEIAIHFKEIPFCLFGRDHGCLMEPNVLALRIQPEEGISLRFAAKAPGEELRSVPVTMDFGYARAFARPIREAYERLLRDIMRGDATLFWRRDEVERAWEVVMPILDRLDHDQTFPIRTYEPGSEGPAEADAMLAQASCFWTPLLAPRPEESGSGIVAA
jgi:glucose-6-phosphate 1-dehydrogenase